MATLAPSPMLRFEDNNGNALVGGSLYTYQAGTTTPQATYTDYTGSTPNANPVVLNTRGEASVWLTPGQSYKFVVKDSLGNTIYTVDQVNSQQAVGVLNSLSNINGTNAITATCTAISAYTATQMFSGVAFATNTGAATININNLGQIPLAINGQALVGGELQAGIPFILYYDGSRANIMANPAFPALGAVNEAQGPNVASAATLNLTAGGNYVHITGTTTVTAITLPQGAERTVVFDGSLTLTNGASLILLTGANIQTQAGDAARFRGEASGVVRCVGYTRASGTPLAPHQIQPISASVGANQLTLILNPTSLDFRSATALTDGTVNTRSVASPVSVIVPNNATLGCLASSAQYTTDRLILVAIDNAGTVELAVINIAGGNNLDETTLISTTAISTLATANNVFYSNSPRTNVPFRVVGMVVLPAQTVAGTWVTGPSLVQGEGGQALAALSSLGFGQTWQNVTGSRSLGTTFYNTTGKPIIFRVRATASVISALQVTIGGVVMQGTSDVAAGSNGVVEYPVNPGFSYQITSTNLTLQDWFELR